MDGHLECESHVSHVSNVSHVSLMSSDDILMAYRQKSLLRSRIMLSAAEGVGPRALVMVDEAGPFGSLTY